MRILDDYEGIHFVSSVSEFAEHAPWSLIGAVAEKQSTRHDAKIAGASPIHSA